MITGNVSKNQSPLPPLKKNLKEKEQQTWQKSLAEAIRDPKELLSILELDTQAAKKKRPNPLFNPQHFPLRVPRSFVSKMKKGDWNDPLLRQVLPLDAESNVTDGFLLDPVNDISAANTKGMLQKYQGRALIITTGACAVHCRYCFRQHFPYSDHQVNKHEWENVMRTLTTDVSINEVILSGGDPLALSDNRLEQLCSQIAAIPHIHTLRLHTRLPLVLPERLDAHFMQWFNALSMQKVMVIHANHANEFDDATLVGLRELHQAGTLLLNQSVLLKGVNNTSDALIKLSQTLLANHVLPYYLHLLDKVQGAAHFEVNEKQALILMQELRNNLPGYLVPKLVREVSGRRSKTIIN